MTRELPPALMLTVQEVAGQLKVSPSYVKKLIAAGTVPSVKIGRCRRVRYADLRAYVDGLSGLTDEVINRLADEAEEGYDIDVMPGRLRHDPPL